MMSAEAIKFLNVIKSRFRTCISGGFRISRRGGCGPIRGALTFNAGTFQ